MDMEDAVKEMENLDKETKCDKKGKEDKDE